MKLSIAVLALISSSDARIRLSKREYVGVTFASGFDDMMEIENDAVKSANFFEFDKSNPGVRFVNQEQAGTGVRFVQSDPIKGSIGHPVVPMGDLTPEQQFEEKQRRTPAPDLKDDENVTSTLKSIEQAEEITGGKFPDPSDPKELAKAAPTPDYHLADSDEEEDEGGDSTVETRRSIKTVENQLKQRWFINAQEKRSFNNKVAKGLIRPEVLDFSDKSDADPQATKEDLLNNETAKKKSVGEASEAAAKKVADADKKPEELKADADEKADAEAKEGAGKALEEGDKKLADKAAGKEEPVAEKKKDAEPEGDFIPPELQGAM